MTNEEFIALLTANTNQTTHLRTYSGTWYTGASRVPSQLLIKIGKVVALLQKKVNEGKLCDKQKEGLLIYNFQPADISENHLFYNLNMVVKPLNELNNTKQNTGVPIQVIVDGSTHRVINCTQGMIEQGLLSKSEAEEEKLEPPEEFGKYTDYKALCCYAAFASYKPILNTADVFDGKYDQGDSMQQSVAFDSCVEARHYLEDKKELGRYFLEVTVAKEDYPKLLKEGISKSLSKITNYFDMKAITNPHTKVSTQVVNSKDELAISETLSSESKSDASTQIPLTSIETTTNTPLTEEESSKRKITSFLEGTNFKKTK